MNLKNALALDLSTDAPLNFPLCRICATKASLIPSAKYTSKKHATEFEIESFKRSHVAQQRQSWRSTAPRIELLTISYYPIHDIDSQSGDLRISAKCPCAQRPVMNSLIQQFVGRPLGC